MYLSNLWPKLKLLLYSISIGIGLVACNDKSELLSGLSETDANQVELVLLSNGIANISKEKAKDATYSILINPKNISDALAILNSAGLPPANFTNFGEVFKKDSFISTPLEEHGRFLYALEQEVASMISRINGVLSVKVVISIPQPNDNLWQNETPRSSASVVVTYQQGSRVDLYTSRIKALVNNAVPGLNLNNIEVVLIAQHD
jgi:type III secretion protein J